MTALAEACGDLQPWLTIVAELIHQPDTQPAIGRTAPGSQPPWNSQAANVWTDIHAMARELEANLRYTVTGRYRPRGGSDLNTLRALDAISKLGEATTTDIADAAARVVSHHITIIMQLPAIDLEQPWRRIPGPCPRCQRPMLRYQEGDRYQPSRLTCLGCCRKARIVEGTVSDGCVEWEDGIIT